MVYVVRKKNKSGVYLYLHRSLYNGGKRSSEYVKYLGKEGALSDKDIRKVIDVYHSKVKRKV